MKLQTSRDPHTRRSPAANALLVLGIFLVAANLRTSITGVGPLVDSVRLHTGLSHALTGMLTALPLIGFSLLSPITPKIARRFGMELTILFSLIVLTAGIAIRSLPSLAALFAGTAMLGLAIAVGNVLLPSLIKRDFPGKIGLMTGLYTAVINVFAGLASGISVPLSETGGLDWRGSLMSWGVLSFLALLVWLPQIRERHVPQTPAASASMWKSKLAWQVTFFMGIQSMLFYIIVAWLPEILSNRGMDRTTAGWMLSLLQIVSLPTSLIVPILAGRKPSQRGIIAVVICFSLIGYSGLILEQGTAFTWLWMIFIGAAGGAYISLALLFMGLRTMSGQKAAELSGMAQFVGYLLAAAGPVVFGLMHDLTGTWLYPLLTLVLFTVLLFVAGMGAGRAVYVETERQTSP